MRSFSMFIALLLMSALAWSTTIYEIQYTTVPGTGNTYPSPLNGTAVSTEGTVTGTGFTGGKYVIAEESGSWKSIVVNDPAHSPALGDKVSITGTVTEVGGCTEIGDITAYSLISSGNAIPAAAPVSPVDLQGYPNYAGEAYESVLVKLTNVKVTLVTGSIFYVAAVSGNTATCQINDGFYTQPHAWTGVISGQVWSEITGIVYYSSPNPPQYRLNPRSDLDLVPLADINTVSLDVMEVEAEKGEIVPVDVIVSKLEESWNVTRYSFTVSFNQRILEFVDADITSTVSSTMPDIELTAMEDSVVIIYQSDNALVSQTNSGVLLKLLFKTLSYGKSDLDLTAGWLSTATDSVDFAILNDGSITIPIQKRLAWLSIWTENDDKYNKKNIFNPWLNQEIWIEYGCLVQAGVPSSKAIIRIYDSQGRLVHTPINEIVETSNGIDSYLWDGRDKNKNLLPIGLYYCHLEVIDRASGKSDTAVQPIIIAAELK